MIGIIDYGCGNIGSIKNMLTRIGVDSSIVSSPDHLGNYDRFILPGVGTYDSGMGNLQDKGFISPLEREVIIQKKPLLGICLGMQLLAKSSEEGDLKGLGWIEGTVVKFRSDISLKIPHMGWCELEGIKENDLLLKELANENRFYFVHSYHFQCEKDLIICYGRHGYDFIAGVRKENIYGVQFHPEKSHKYGMKLLENFALL